MALSKTGTWLGASALALMIAFGGVSSEAQEQDQQLSQATEVSTIPSPEGLNGVQGMRTAIELSKGIEVFPVTVNLQADGAHLAPRIQAGIENGLRMAGVNNVWVHFNINNGNSTSIEFWINEVPHIYNISEVNAETLAREAQFHKAHQLNVLENAALSPSAGG